MSILPTEILPVMNCEDYTIQIFASKWNTTFTRDFTFIPGIEIVNVLPG